MPNYICRKSERSEERKGQQEIKATKADGDPDAAVNMEDQSSVVGPGC